MSLVKWFDGDSKKVLQLMVEQNCAVLFYLGEENDDFSDIFNDTNVIHLLNNELLLCFKMKIGSTSYTNFQQIFKNIVIPSIYLLERNNIKQYIIKKQSLKSYEDIQMNLKHQLLNAIYNIIKDISDKIDEDNNKKKYLHYLKDVNDKLKIINNPAINHEIQNLSNEYKKSDDFAKIKIKVPFKNITIIQEFKMTDSLNDVKTFILNHVQLPKGPIKLIAHRQFTDEDFYQTLNTLNLYPSSTIYVHMVPLGQWTNSIFNSYSWLRNLFNFTILNPLNFIQNYIISFVRPTPPIEEPSTVNRQNVTKTVKKPKFKSSSNIHQLRTNNSDDDENNTYNGNSTQQM